MSKSLRKSADASTFFLCPKSYNRVCLNTNPFCLKRKWGECVLRIICGCIIFGEFYDGLSVVASCEEDVKVFCHTRKRLLGSFNRVCTDLCSCNYSNSICNHQNHFISHLYKHLHDSSGTKNQNHTSVCQITIYAVHRKFFVRGHFRNASTICEDRKSIFLSCDYWILPGFGDMEIYFTCTEMESIPL